MEAYNSRELRIDYRQEEIKMSLQGVLFPMRKLFENLKLRNLKIEKYYTELIQTLGD